MERVCLETEVNYNFVRSSGAGGQHVNKVATKVVLTFDVVKSRCLTEKEQAVILEKLANRISKEGVLSLSVSKSRSQYKNKKEALDFFIQLLEIALIPVKKRKPTKKTKSSVLKRLHDKKEKSQRKEKRRKPFVE
jgi:ribosome-associated protein